MTDNGDVMRKTQWCISHFIPRSFKKPEFRKKKLTASYLTLKKSPQPKFKHPTIRVGGDIRKKSNKCTRGKIFPEQKIQKNLIIS